MNKKNMYNISNIEELLLFVWHNKFSDFYVKKYQAASLTEKEVLDPKNFIHLPFLTRQELESILPDQRFFVSPEEIQFIAFTSGTSNQNPLITYFSKIDNYYFDPTLGMGVKRLLITYPPLNKNFGHTFVQQCAQSKNKSFPVFADYQNLANSAIIASKVKVDAIYATPTIASLLAEFIEKYYDPKEIKLLALSSETLTSARREELKKKYPSAKIANLYGSSEIGQFILFPCQKIINEEKDLFHILQPPVLKTELINGELIITYANNKAMPLIRYQTGDFFEIANKKCSCGLSGPLLRWLGRENIDKIRVSGVEIKIDDVEKVFNQISHLIGDRYQLHFYENRDDSNVKIKIIIEIIEQNSAGKFLPLEDIKTFVINHLMNNWRLSSTARLKDAVDKGLFLAPEIKFVKEFSFKSDKTKRLISHLNEN